jgi:hypothetical protein
MWSSNRLPKIRSVDSGICGDDDLERIGSQTGYLTRRFWKSVYSGPASLLHPVGPGFPPPSPTRSGSLPLDIFILDSFSSYFFLGPGLYPSEVSNFKVE